MRYFCKSSSQFLSKNIIAVDFVTTIRLSNPHMCNLFDHLKKIDFCKVVNIQATGEFAAQKTLNDL